MASITTRVNATKGVPCWYVKLYHKPAWPDGLLAYATAVAIAGKIALEHVSVVLVRLK